METITVYSAYDEKPIDTFMPSSEKQVDTMLADAHKVFSDKSQWLLPVDRIKILENLLLLMRERRDDLIHTAALEGGKPYVDTAVEVDRAINGVQVAIEHIPQLTGNEIPMNINAASLNAMAYTFRQPRGVVLAISAFNHPVNLIIHQVIPAIATGCPVLIKPATTTPRSCFKIVEMLYEAGLPKVWCQAFVSTNPVAEKALTDERISFFSFIGSAKVGWYLRSKLPAGATCALEHGGVAPVVVEPDADFDSALPSLCKGGFYHAGQVCVSVQRVFAHESIADDIAQRLAELASKLKVGDPLDPKTDVGPLIAAREVERVDNWIHEAVNAGGKLLTGGNRISNTCYEPTVVFNPPDDVQLSTHEIFGPAVAVYSYKNIDEAINRANALPYAFQAAVYTSHIDKAMKCVKDLEANAVMINTNTAFRVDWMPFGGRKQSGLGFGGIPYSMHDMSYEKLFVLKSPSL